MLSGAQKSRNLRRRRYAYVLAEKARRGFRCIRCDNSFPSHPYVLDFHHRNRDDKLFSVSQAVQAPEITLKREMEKCDLYCANCHRIVEYSEKATA